MFGRLRQKVQAPGEKAILNAGVPEIHHRPEWPLILGIWPWLTHPTRGDPTETMSAAQLRTGSERVPQAAASRPADPVHTEHKPASTKLI